VRDRKTLERGDPFFGKKGSPLSKPLPSTKNLKKGVVPMRNGSFF
jgi:hypothetical protein